MKKKKDNSESVCTVTVELYHTMRIFQPDSAFFAPMCSTLRSALSSWLGATCLACIEGSDFYDSTNVRNESVPGLLGRTNLGPMCEKYPRPRKSYPSVPTVQ